MAGEGTHIFFFGSINQPDLGNAGLSPCAERQYMWVAADARTVPVFQLPRSRDTRSHNKQHVDGRTKRHQQIDHVGDPNLSTVDCSADAEE